MWYPPSPACAHLRQRAIPRAWRLVGAHGRQEDDGHERGGREAHREEAAPRDPSGHQLDPVGSRRHGDAGGINIRPATRPNT